MDHPSDDGAGCTVMFWDHGAERDDDNSSSRGLQTVYRYAYAGGLSTVADRNRALHSHRDAYLQILPSALCRARSRWK